MTSSLPDQLIELQGCAPLPSQPDGDKNGPRTDCFNTNPDSGMGRLEALVAVATSENKEPAKLFL